MFTLSEKERQALAQADRLNSILSQSNIKEASEAAWQRAKQQEAERALSRRLAQDDAQTAATLGFREREGELDRAAALERAGVMAEALTPPELRKAREQEMTFSQADAAVNQLEGLAPDQSTSGFAGFAYNVLRDMGYTNLAKGLASMAFDDDEKRGRAMVDASVEAFKRALAGANLTAAEVGLSSNWDPAQAQSDADKIARLRDMQAAINANRAVLNLPQLDSMQPAGPAQPGLTDRARSYLRTPSNGTP